MAHRTVVNRTPAFPDWAGMAVMKAMRSAAMCLLAVVGLIALAGCDSQTTGTYALEINGTWFTLEVAATPAAREKGLSGRESIAEDGGMIFVFDTDEQRSFWMIDCLVDIDIMYVDHSGYVVSTYTMEAQAPMQHGESREAYKDRIRRSSSHPSKGKARYVIELQAGMVEKLGIKRGDKIDLDTKSLKTMLDNADSGEGPNN
ncbi:MAG: DUF192 domain-containing protein [Planctomycetes bacterium]|nr:DUF192 domain-containing protein [Planctomycetota bacterium]